MPSPCIGPTSISDCARISMVCEGLPYPAATWQPLAHADHHGADAVSRAELHRLPTR